MTNKNKPTFALFYSNSCPHSHYIMNEWDTFSDNMNGYKDINIKKFECSENTELFKFFNIDCYPVIKFCWRGINNPFSIKYTGEITTTELTRFLKRPQKWLYTENLHILKLFKEEFVYNNY